MRAGMSGSDLYHLSPGQRFTRIFDLRQMLYSIPSSPSGQTRKTITVSLPTAFKGIFHLNAYAVAAAASADLTGVYPRLGNFSTVPLHDVSLTSARLALQLKLPLFQTGGTADRSPPDGIIIDPTDCKGQRMGEALFDAAVYASSLLRAANDAPNSLLGSYFVPPAQQTIVAVAKSIQNALRGRGAHADLYCTDGQNICGSNPNVLGYSYSPSWLGNAYVVLCPAARRLPRAPKPCSSASASRIDATISHVLFHLMLTLNSVVAHTIGGNVYGSDACRGIKDSSVFDPTENADSYAQLAIAQWAYGLGGSPYEGLPCAPDDAIVHRSRKRTTAVADDTLSEVSNVTIGALKTRQFSEAYTEKQSILLVDAVAGTQQCGGALGQFSQLAIQNAQRLAFDGREDGKKDLFAM
ncbi:MAG: hypothetical protein Q9219_000191 [cf. Caloplaca sp. 3 TL-2023]